MAGTPAGLPRGIRLSDRISLGVIAQAFPPDRVRRVLAETGRASERERDLPAHVMVDYAIALALYAGSGTREVLRGLLAGLRWLWGAEAVKVAGESDITLESTPGQGSTFTVELPARYPAEPPAPVAEVAEAALPSSPTEGAAPEAESREPLVLAIDDDPNMLYLLRENLGEAGYRVVAADGGETGVQKARELRPQAIVLDILMPHKDGRQVLHELKADPLTRDIPVIVLSIIDQKDLGYRLGAFDHLLKPFDREALLATLARIAAPPCRVLVVDDDPLVIDLVRQLLEQQGCEIDAAADGREALAVLAVRRPDVVLLDLLMPRLDGLGVIGQLEQNPAWRDLPVIVLTAKTLEAQERALLQRRVLAVIEKRGLERTALLAELRRALPAYCGRKPEAAADEEDPDRRGRRAEPRPARAAS